MNVSLLLAIISNLIVIFVIGGYVAYGGWCTYKYIFGSYQLKVSDTKTAYLSLKFKNFKDELIVYTTCYGKEFYFKCIQGEYDACSINYHTPSHYASPYEYVMSGDLNSEISDLRVLVDIKATMAKEESNQIQSENYIHLRQSPVVFEDVGDLVRKRLGVLSK